MTFISLLLILIASSLNFLEGILVIISSVKDFVLPNYFSSSLLSLQVLLLFFAMIFSLINLFTNRKTYFLQKFVLLSVSSTLFFATLNWLLTTLLTF
tara:strand:+ start:1554 stop:1844 length:291 start_codon:yes stop_codon:yes gene_type:complete